jgi:branched-chain amino acid transport system ATP-binding protein
MLALARAWILRPALLLVDEPSMGLAPQVVREVFAVLGRFKEMGMTVLLVEQNAEDGLACADWGYVLDLGHNRFDGPAATILAHPEIRELYLGKAARHGSPA